MKENPSSPQQQPTVVKYTQSYRNGVQISTLYRNAIGYITRGKRYVYHGDLRREIGKGNIYYLRAGNHYIEDVPEPNKPFEQIVFYYDTFQINKILNQLSLNYRLDIRNDHDCPECRGRSEVFYPAWSTLKNFFTSVAQYLTDDVFGNDEAAENLKITELVYLILSHENCCLKKCILNNADASLASFEQTVYDNVFNDIPIGELAKKCNRSLTSFKKEFKKHFNEPPHKWCIRQRLMHARLLLVSTGRSVAEIGNECNLPNTSHFIKLFKKEYGMTPVAYRKAHERIMV